MVLILFLLYFRIYNNIYVLCKYFYIIFGDFRLINMYCTLHSFRKKKREKIVDDSFYYYYNYCVIFVVNS